MYTVTFYSFKGGVGRTMALANVAYELASRGRRVLMVDFDLEAPGLDSFGLPRAHSTGRGVLDFINDYMSTSETPDVRAFVRECPAEVSGKLWIMPAGQMDEGYAYRLSQVDWRRLYEEHDGFLVLEDLRAQWEKEFRPDYVLVDSRTGHTDVGGICTRQLPDACVVLFFPNGQNLRGLQRVVDEIRDEAAPPRQKQIDLHFVMSNVPDMDDEDRILERNMSAFRRNLRIDRLHTIHRYDSLALLNQAVFTRDRPRSRLAREYRRLVDAIVSQNIEDREGALSLLSGMSRVSPEEDPGLERELERVASVHATDGAVLEALARVRIRQGRVDEALAFADRAVGVSPDGAEALRTRAVCRRILGQRQGAVDDIRHAMAMGEAGKLVVAEGLRTFRRFDIDRQEVVACPAAHGLAPDDRRWFASQLNWDRSELGLARGLLDELMKGPGEPSAETLRIMTLVLIGIGAFEEALRAIPPFTDASPIDEVFNRAMADWGAHGEPNAQLFQRVRELHHSRSGFENANYLQCIALAHAVKGEREETERLGRRAESRLGPQREFSCWRYLAVPGAAFSLDVDSIIGLSQGRRTRPQFGEKTKRS